MLFPGQISSALAEYLSKSEYFRILTQYRLFLLKLASFFQMWFQFPQWFRYFIQKAKEKWVSSNSHKRIKGHVMEAAAKSQTANWNKPNRNRNVTFQGALSANLVANRMWASVTVCREEVIQNSKFRHRPGLLPSKETVRGRRWEGVGMVEKRFQPTRCSPAYLGFPQSLFYWIISQAVIFKCDVHRQPPWNRAAGEACACARKKRRNDRLLVKMRLWTTTAASAALRRGNRALVKRHTVHRKEQLLLGLKQEQEGSQCLEQGRGKKRIKHCSMESRTLCKWAKLHHLLHWANPPSWTPTPWCLLVSCYSNHRIQKGCWSILQKGD